MRNVRANRGPFAERPFYREDEIEAVCTDELRKVNLLPQRPEPVRIDRFIEKRFQVAPQYEDLGEGILGMTLFTAKGVSAVIVARSLENEGSETAERRIRSTIAHEGGHGLLHAHLFALGSGPAPLFADATNPDKPKVLCRGEGGSHVAPGYSGEWWEFQANRAMAALLMPRHLVDVAVEDFFVPVGLLGLPSFDRNRLEEAARSLADIFQVNPALARIRLNTLYPAGSPTQMGL